MGLCSVALGVIMVAEKSPNDASRSAVKSHRFAVPAAVAFLLLACDSTSPTPNLDGVWGGNVNMFATTDSLTLALGEQDGQIRGWATQRPLDAPRYTFTYLVAGSISGRSVELNLQGEGFSSLVLKGEASGPRFYPTLTMSVVDRPITLRRSIPRDQGVAGTWGLASTSGPALAVRDTIEVLLDGRARRHR